MKGIVFVLFEEFLTRNWSIETLEAVLDDCPQLQREPFVSPRTYPDAWLTDLLLAACRRLAIQPEVALRTFGKFCLHGLAARFPNFVDGVADARQMLLMVNDIIHVEVKKLMFDAVPPVLHYSDEGPATLSIRYESPRGLCSFLEGLLDGVGEHFGEPVEHTHPSCKHRGDATCTFRVHFPALVPA